MSINYKAIRDYFETGCLCILTGRVKLQVGETDEWATGYYMLMCQCSRHPEGYQWDMELEDVMKEELKGKL